MEILLSVFSALGVGGILLFFIKRYFDKRDRRESEREEEYKALFEKIDNSLETLRLLAYARLSEEVERLLTKGYATPTERHILDELFKNYKAHGWNGDMNARLEMVYSLPTIQKGELK